MNEMGGPSRTPRAAGTVVIWGVRNLLLVLEARGLDASPVRTAAGLLGRDLDDPDARLDAAAAYRAWEAAIALTGDADLGLHVATAQPAGAVDILEYAFRYSATLRSGFEQLVRYSRVMHDALQARVEGEGERVSVSFTLAPSAPLLRQQAESFLATWIRVAREATHRPDLAPLEVHFRHAAPEPASAEALARFFRAPVRFGQAAPGLAFDRETMALRMARPEPGLAVTLGQRLARLVPALPPATPSSLGLEVRSRVAAGLPSGNVTAERAAAELGLSPRTLARRLEEEGTSFRRILEQVRREAAERYLADPRTSFGEIAFLLGYSESSAFHRSWKRWTGRTPLEHRQSARA